LEEERGLFPGSSRVPPRQGDQREALHVQASPAMSDRGKYEEAKLAVSDNEKFEGGVKGVRSWKVILDSSGYTALQSSSTG